MAYLKTNDNGVVIKYPYTLTDLRRDYPNVSFPRNYNLNRAWKYNVYPYTVDEQPEYDPYTQKVVLGSPQNNGGVWSRSWNIIELTAEEQQQYLEQQRSRMRTYKRAFRFALDQVIYSANTEANTSVTLLEAIQTDISSRPFNDSTRRAWEDVTIYERSHPDMALLYNAGLTDEEIDDIFNVAITFETNPGAFANT